MQQVENANLDEITLKDLFGIVRSRIAIIATFTFICALGSGIAAFLAPKWYQASTILLPVSTASGGGLSGSNSQIGGLAALAGISVGSDSKKSESVAVLQSEALTEQYINANGLLPILYDDRWDTVAKQWKTKTDVPTLWKANEYFKKTIRSVSTDPKTGIITLTITWKNATTAARWANGIAALTNDYLRNKAIAESEKNIAYLSDEAAKTNIVEARKAIYTVLETELNKAMVARGSPEYAFKILDPATPAERVYSPVKSLWVVIGLFSGFFISTLAIFVYESWQ